MKELQQLREITARLNYPSHSKLPTTNVVERVAGAGHIFFFTIYKTDELKIYRCFASQNAVWTVAGHSEWKMYIVWKGELHLMIDCKKEVTLTPKRSYYIDTFCSYTLSFSVDTSFLLIEVSTNT